MNSGLHAVLASKTKGAPLQNCRAFDVKKILYLSNSDTGLFLLMNGSWQACAVAHLQGPPARIMGVLDRKGTLERGKDADIIALDRDLNVRAVWAMGELVEGTNKLF